MKSCRDTARLWRDGAHRAMRRPTPERETGVEALFRHCFAFIYLSMSHYERFRVVSCFTGRGDSHEHHRRSR